jgi:DNA ligase (NAD+)
VIPQIVANLTRDEPRAPWAFPLVCPECGSAAERELAEVDYRCTGGLICPAQRVERLRHFVSRHALDIEGLGITHIESFFHDKLLQTPADIFRLTKEELLKRERWAEISASNLIAAIDDKRTPRSIASCSRSASAMSARLRRAISRAIIRAWTPSSR